MTTYTTIAESKNFIVLDKYTKQEQVAESYQSEDALERELIQDLQNQGYKFVAGMVMRVMNLNPFKRFKNS